jgi:hypothetical protein
MHVNITFSFLTLYSSVVDQQINWGKPWDYLHDTVTCSVSDWYTVPSVNGAMKEMKQPQMSSYVTVGFLHQQHFMRRPIKPGTAINLKCSNVREVISCR